eukprot:PhF_6_TR25956/c1_g2_i1/m.36620
MTQRKCLNVFLFAMCLFFVYFLPTTSTVKHQYLSSFPSSNFSSERFFEEEATRAPRNSSSNSSLRSCYNTVQDALANIDSSRGVVVLSVGNGMEAFVPHWVVNAHRFGFLQSSIINAQTKDARRYMEYVPLKHSVTCYSRTDALDIESGAGGDYGSRNYVTLISDRFYLVRDLLQMGVTVFVLDVDVVPFSNILEAADSEPPAEVWGGAKCPSHKRRDKSVASVVCQGQPYIGLCNIFLFGMVSGVCLLRPSPGTLRVVNLTLSLCGTSEGVIDQLAFNAAAHYVASKDCSFKFGYWNMATFMKASPYNLWHDEFTRRPIEPPKKDVKLVHLLGMTGNHAILRKLHLLKEFQQYDRETDFFESSSARSLLKKQQKLRYVQVLCENSATLTECVTKGLLVALITNRVFVLPYVPCSKMKANNWKSKKQCTAEKMIDVAPIVLALGEDKVRESTYFCHRSVAGRDFTVAKINQESQSEQIWNATEDRVIIADAVSLNSIVKNCQYQQFSTCEEALKKSKSLTLVCPVPRKYNYYPFQQLPVGPVCMASFTDYKTKKKDFSGIKFRTSVNMSVDDSALKDLIHSDVECRYQPHDFVTRRN